MVKARMNPKERFRRGYFALIHFAQEVKSKVAERIGTVTWRDTAGPLVNLIFPPHALEDFQNRPLDPDQRQSIGLDAHSWSQIRFLDAEGCAMCARPFANGLHMGEGARCEACSQKPFAFSKARAACIYDEASKGVILAFKHADRLDLAPMLSRWLERAAAPLGENIDVIVPVPLHASRLWVRRYNQSAELARPLAKYLGRDYLGDGLRRLKKTVPQGSNGGGYEARFKNVKGAFSLSPAGQKAVRGRCILLIDDVFTTGATLNACAKTLLEGGAREVYAAVLARVVPKDSL